MKAEMAADPQKAECGLCRPALQLLEWELGYHVLDSLRARFACVFRFIEQHKASLQDLVANKGEE
jgi:hypothetical protein